MCYIGSSDLRYTLLAFATAKRKPLKSRQALAIVTLASGILYIVSAKHSVHSEASIIILTPRTCCSRSMKDDERLVISILVCLGKWVN